MPCSACGKKLALASNRPISRSTTFRMGFSGFRTTQTTKTTTTTTIKTRPKAFTLGF